MLREIIQFNDDPWEFRLTKMGVGYWISKKSKISTKDFPYISDIREGLRQTRKTCETLKVLPQYSSLTQIPKKLIEFKPDGIGDEIHKKIKQEAREFINSIFKRKLDYLNRNNKDSSQNVLIPRGGYNLKNLAEYIGKKVTKEEALDILFACPFELNVQPEVEDISESSPDEESPIAHLSETSSPKSTASKKKNQQNKEGNKNINLAINEVREKREELLRRASIRDVSKDIQKIAKKYKQTDNTDTMEVKMVTIMI